MGTFFFFAVGTVRRKWDEMRIKDDRTETDTKQTNREKKKEQRKEERVWIGQERRHAESPQKMKVVR